jgi:hypothetical protein
VLCVMTIRLDYSTQFANERKTGVRWHQHNTSAGCIAPRRRLATNYTRGVKQASKHPIRAMKPASSHHRGDELDRRKTRGAITPRKLDKMRRRCRRCNPGPGVV